MNYRVQFLDASAAVIAEWSADAHSARGTIALLSRKSAGQPARCACEFSTGTAARFTSGAGGGGRQGQGGAPKWRGVHGGSAYDRIMPRVAGGCYVVASPKSGCWRFDDSRDR